MRIRSWFFPCSGFRRGEFSRTTSDFIANGSNRGWALHLGLSPSCIDCPALPDLEDYRDADIHVQGLLDLVGLFMAFDQISVRRKSSPGIIFATDLTETENKLSSLCLSISDQVTTRMADCHITREWMRTMIWQEALSMGLLSSASFADVMTFGFPAQVGHDLLQALRCFSQSDLLPLGRDQVRASSNMPQDCLLIWLTVVEVLRSRKLARRHRSSYVLLSSSWVRVGTPGFSACTVSEDFTLLGARPGTQLNPAHQNCRGLSHGASSSINEAAW